MKIVDAEQMREIERICELHSLSPRILAENAGSQTAALMFSLFPDILKKNTSIICGPGNNGADGLILARHLSIKGVRTNVFLLAEPKTQLCKDALSLIKDTLPICRIKEDIREILRESHIIVDALFGTGLLKDIEGDAKEVVEAINEAKGIVLSLDIPTGVCANTGEIKGVCVDADYTVALGVPKKGHFLFPGAEHRGRLFVVDLGIPKNFYNHIKLELLEAEKIKSLLPSHSLDAHKGERGRVAVIAGSISLSGAAILACSSAYKVGAGMVYLFCPKTLYNIMEQTLPETIVHPCPDEEGMLSEKAIPLILSSVEKMDVVLFGPGLGRGECISKLLEELLKLNIPKIIDADGINAIKAPSLIYGREDIVLTPHPGEMGRVLKMEVESIRKRKIEVAMDFCKKFHGTLVLKGAFTVVAKGEEVYICPVANPFIGTAGSGDVLSGMIAGFLAQKKEPFSATLLSVYLHAVAGNLASKKELPILASDIMKNIPYAINFLKEGRIHEEGFYSCPYNH